MEPDVIDTLRELHDAIVDYLVEFDYPTRGPSWERLRMASADAAVVLKVPGRFGDRQGDQGEGQAAILGVGALMTDEQTTNIGQVCVGDEDDEANFYYVNVVNHYRVPEGGARIDGRGGRHFDELANHLRINSEVVARVIDVPITREDCLQLARMFLNAANHYSWEEMPDA